MGRRVIIVAPQQGIGANIDWTLRTVPEEQVYNTVLMRTMGAEVQETLGNLRNQHMVVVAGTGTGKTVLLVNAISEWLGVPREVWLQSMDIVHSNSEEIPNFTRDCMVIATVPQVALLWEQEGFIDSDTLVVLDEIHLSSTALELAQGLALRNEAAIMCGSATVDPTYMIKYFEAKAILCEANDPTCVTALNLTVKSPMQIIDDLAPQIIEEKLGVLVFLPTRLDTERAVAALRAKYPEKIRCNFYHGGESPQRLRRMLMMTNGPFIYCMTRIGASSLNVQNLSIVIAKDEMITEVVRGNRRVLVRCPLSDNELLQMIGRVKNRAKHGQVFVSSKREIELDKLTPKPIVYELNGDLEEVAFTAARLHINITELRLPGEPDLKLYQDQVNWLIGRDIITMRQGRPYLTKYGRKVDEHRLGDVRWAEIITHAYANPRYASLIDMLLLLNCAASLSGWVKESVRKTDWFVEGSDHLTLYNLLAVAINQSRIGYTERTDRPGYVTSQHTIRWCEDRGVDVQELHDFFTVSRACYHHLRRELPTPGTLKPVTKTQIQLFVDLIIETQSLQLIESSSASPVAQGALAGGKFEYVLGALRFVNLNADQPELVQFEGTVIGRERIMANLATRQTNLHYADFSSNTIPIELSDVFAGKPFGAPVRMKVPIQQVEPNWMSVLIRQLAEHVARGDTKLAGLDEIVNANKAQHERVSRINASVGRTLLPMTDLVTFYERVLWAHGILVLQELQDFSAFAMKPLDESRLKTQLEKLGRPETICIGGCSFRVRYNPEKGEAIVRIPFQNFSLEVLRAIPDALVFPGLTLQMAVYLFENHAAYYHSDLVALKRSVADYLAHKRWEATTRPNLQLPTQVTIGMVPPPVCEVAYGDDALTGEPQKKFGTWSIKSSYSSDRTAFSETWCNTQEEAEALREAVIEEIAIRQPELLRYAAYEARREHARAVQAQLADSLCGKARYYASSFRESRFDEWLPEGERLLAEESTWLEQYVRAQAVSDLADAALRQPAIYNALDDAAYQTLEAIALDETTRRRDIRLQEMSLEAITSWNIESFTALASFVPKDRFGDLWEEFKLA